MKFPPIADVETNLKNCLLLKADDLYFTMGEEEASGLREKFIGIEIDGLADENVSPEDFAQIDLNRFAIYPRVRLLYKMLEDRVLGDRCPNIPDSEYFRQDGLEFVEYFLSSLPSVAMGGWNMTSEADGQVKEVYTLAHAWLDLIDTIDNACAGEMDCNLTIGDLSQLSGLDRRTVHNRCGPNKEIRTTVQRYAQPARKAVDPAFVTVHPFDAIGWLCSRPSFRIQPIDRLFVEKLLAPKLVHQRPVTMAGRTRGALIAALVNGTKLKNLLTHLDISLDQCRKWYDTGDEIPETYRAKLADILGCSP